MILVVAHSMLHFHKKFNTESISSERRRCYATTQDADDDGVLPAADGARGPWKRTPAGNGGIDMILAPVSRGRAGGGDEGGGRPVAHATILLVCFSFTLLVPTARSAPPPRAAYRSIRLLCVSTTCLPTRAASCLVAAVHRCKGGDGRVEQGRGGRVFEVTDIATTDDKMLMEEMLNNITWTSTGAGQTDIFLNFLAVRDSA